MQYFLRTSLNSIRIFSLLLFGLVIPAYSVFARADIQPPVQLAKIYSDELNVSAFLVSEKYDGIRAIWKDGRLQTRKGTPIHAPRWFIKGLPDVWLDGELWSKRQNFEFIASTVSKDIPIDKDWAQITYMVFDAPAEGQTFAQRAERYNHLIKRLELPHIKAVQQQIVQDNASLSQLLNRYTQSGAEGLMLHRADALYQSGRTNNLLKLKPYMDAEATVLAHLPGKGKYDSMLGALKVAWRYVDGEQVVFKIGSGFSDAERAEPPPLGSVVTFKYHGLTRLGKPRFASFLRIRDEQKNL